MFRLAFTGATLGLCAIGFVLLFRALHVVTLLCEMVIGCLIPDTVKSSGRAGEETTAHGAVKVE